ncbi:Non-specific serine/threonine protein kinase protein [Dioscorea alata]|uniref:Non-specific serine/threonine protein kinase protein n=1 Tax=Dioscorea alata TaxID=55571 RepID=A0ACB7UP82_DIOAL|nr:Non-specific serine/threonine protein kinase protein [Dioscorea alata]
MRCIYVGLLCVQEHPGDRPLMSSVLLMLGSDRAILPYPKEPGFSVRNVSYQMESGSSKASSSAACDTSATLIEPR